MNHLASGLIAMVLSHRLYSGCIVAMTGDFYEVADTTLE